MSGRIKVEIICGSVANAHGLFLRGAIVEGPENDWRPLVDAGLACEVTAGEPEPVRQAKPKKGA